MSFYGDEPVAYAGFGRGTPRHDIELRKTTFMVTKFIVAVITPEPGHADTVEQALEVVVPAVRREPGAQYLVPGGDFLHGAGE